MRAGRVVMLACAAFMLAAGPLAAPTSTAAAGDQLEADPRRLPGLGSIWQGLPPSPVPDQHPGRWTLEKFDALPAGEAPDWPGLDESQVFHTRLVHTQMPGNSWELRIGKGSQIYSIRTSLGQLIGAQNTWEGGQWVDRVLQTVLVNREKNSSSAAKYFIHQAGTYARDGLDGNFFSPLLREVWLPDRNTYLTTVWPQQAHIPSPHRSGIILEQAVRDVGDGIIEVTYLYHNFGSDPIDFVNTPWIGLRRSVLPVHVVGGKAGEAVFRPPELFSDQQATLLEETGGWIALLAGKGPAARGLGLVVGRDRHFKQSFQPSRSSLRVGNVNGQDLTVVSFQHRPVIEPGTSYFFRFYLVVGTLSRIQQAANTMLSQAVDYGPVHYGEGDAGLTRVCERTTPQGQRVAGLACPSEASVLFYSYPYPPPGAVPLLLVRDEVNRQLRLTIDPHKWSSKPYDGQVSYLRLFGWAMPAALRDEACFDYVTISTVLEPGFYPADTRREAGLRARAGPENMCK